MSVEHEIERLVVRITGNGEQYIHALAHTHGATLTWAQSMRVQVNKVGLLMTEVLGGAMVALAVNWELTAKKMSETNIMSKRLGVDVKELSQLGHVAKMNGVDLDSMTTALRFMNRNLSNAAQGAGPAADGLKELGLSAKELQKLSPHEQMLKLADALHGVERQGDRVRLAMEIFGRGGVNIIHIMQQGGDAIKAMEAEADRLGITFSEAEAEMVHAAENSTIKIMESITGIRQQITIGMAPAVQVIADGLLNWGGAAHKAKGEMSAVAQFTADAFGKVMDVFHQLSIWLKECNLLLLKLGVNSPIERGKALSLDMSATLHQEHSRNAQAQADNEIKQYQNMMSRKDELVKLYGQESFDRNEAFARKRIESLEKYSKDENKLYSEQIKEKQRILDEADAKPKDIAKAQKELDAAKLEATPSELIKRKIEEMQRESSKPKEDQKALENMFAALQKGDEFVKKMKDELNSFGASDLQKQLIQAEAAGASFTNEQREQLTIMDQQLTKLKEQEDLYKELAGKAASMMVEQLKPIEKLKKDMDELDKMVKQGVLSKSQAEKLGSRMRQAYLDNLGTYKPSAGGAVEAGTREAYSATHFGDQKKTSEEMLKQQLAETKVSVQTEKQILEEMKKQKAAVTMNMMDTLTVVSMI